MKKLFDMENRPQQSEETIHFHSKSSFIVAYTLLWLLHSLAIISSLSGR